MTLTVLDVWLKENSFSNSAIGLITVVNLPYIFKFLWAPFIDIIHIPFFSEWLGHKKSWTLLSQILIAFSLFAMANCDPANNFVTLIFFATLATFATSCQNIALYSFQIDNIKNKEFGSTASIVIFGYRIGMLVASSGTLFLADIFGWKIAYSLIATLVLCCCCSILFLPEPNQPNVEEKRKIKKLISRLTYRQKNKKLSFVKAVFFECLIYPFEFFKKHKYWLQHIFIIATFKASDVMIHKMSKPLYIELGFSKPEIASIVGIFGVFATIIGGFIGGYILKKYRVKRSLLFCGIFHTFANLAYLLLYFSGHNIILFYITVTIENLSGGMMMTAFLSFLYKLCSTIYPATQYALLWGIHGITATFFRGISGILVDNIGWVNFYLSSLIIAIPSIVSIYLLISKDNGFIFRKRL